MLAVLIGMSGKCLPSSPGRFPAFSTSKGTSSRVPLDVSFPLELFQLSELRNLHYIEFSNSLVLFYPYEIHYCK